MFDINHSGLVEKNDMTSFVTTLFEEIIQRETQQSLLSQFRSYLAKPERIFQNTSNEKRSQHYDYLISRQYRLRI